MDRKITILPHFLDELVIAPISAVSGALPKKSAEFSNRVGAIVEYELYRRNNRPELPPLSQFPSSQVVKQISDLLDGYSPHTWNLSLQATHADAIKIPETLGAAPVYTAFIKRAEATARVAGFADAVAAGFAGAIRELADNVIQHSEAPSSGIVAFSRNSNQFEYVVADTGIGMLASLRKAAEFQALRDDLEALPLAVTPGVSRHGRGVGYGYGFRAVFVPLKAASGLIRLRSGRAVLQIFGDGPQLDQGQCSQRPHHQGVVVAVTVTPNRQ